MRAMSLPAVQQAGPPVHTPSCLQAEQQDHLAIPRAQGRLRAPQVQQRLRTAPEQAVRGAARALPALLLAQPSGACLRC